MNHGALVNIILGGLVALVPLITRISVQPGQEVHHEFLLYWAILAFVALPIKKLRTAPRIAWFSAGIILLLAYWNQHEPKSIAVFMHGSWSIIGALFAIKLYEVYDWESSHYLFDAIALGCVIQSTLCIIEPLGVNYAVIVSKVMGWGYQNSKQWNANLEALGSLGGTNWTGVYVALTGMALLRPGRWYLLPLPALALYLVGATTAQAAFAAGICCMMWHRFVPKCPPALLYISSIAAFMGASFAGLLDGLQNGRFQAWKVMIENFPMSGWAFGKGPGWFYDTFWQKLRVEGGYFRQEHNEFLAVLFAYGVFGLLLAFIWYISAADAKGNPIFKAILFAAFVSFFGHFTMHQATAGLIVLIAFGAVFIEEKHGEAMAG